jgi:hypothetical protein
LQRVELRFPLLDTRVLEFVMAVPPIPWCQGKTLPRSAFRDRLPREVVERRKRGAVGFNERLVADWRARWTDRRRPLSPPIDAWVDPQLWMCALRSPNHLDVMAAWRVLELERWLASRPRPCRSSRTGVAGWGKSSGVWTDREMSESLTAFFGLP